MNTGFIALAEPTLLATEPSAPVQSHLSQSWLFGITVLSQPK